jgi:hypothetical protein
MRWGTGVIVGMVMSIGAAPASAEKQCISFGGGQFYDAIHYCVSSQLGDQYGNSYSPRNLLDGNSQTAWCEGVAGNGEGETVTVIVEGGPSFRRLIIGNGYGKSRKSYYDNARARLIQITTDAGLRTQHELIDQSPPLPVYLPQVGSYRWVEIKILSVYPGQKYTDTCLGFIVPDFEYEEMLFQQQQNSAGTGDPALPGPESSGTIVDPVRPSTDGWWNTLTEGFRRTGEGIRKQLMGRDAIQ